MKAFSAALEKHKKELFKIPGVVSVGIGHKLVGGKMTKHMSIIVGVVKKLPLNEVPGGEIIPPVVNNLPTDVIEVGRIRTLE